MAVNCCKKEVEGIEALLASYWEKVKGSYSSLFTRQYAAEVFGKECHYYDKLNDLNYLSTLLTLMYFDIVRERENKPCSEWIDLNFYITKYKIECIATKFNCAGLNIVPLVKLFLPVVNLGNGIGAMKIEGNGDCDSAPFIVS